MRVAVCVFAKPPRPGQVKTRLAAGVGADAAAALAFAFFRDTWAAVSGLPDVTPVLAVPELSEDLARTVGDAQVWLQGPGDLGAKMEAIAARALAVGFDAVIELGADSPTLPMAYVAQAVALLEAHDAVLGPSDDGGFYLLGLRRHQPGMLANLPWSQSNTRCETERRLRECALSLAHTPGYFDVDDEADLKRLAVSLAEGDAQAVHTAAALASMAGHA